MNVNEVKDLLSQFDQSTLTEFDFKQDNFELYMNKNSASGKSFVEAAPVQAQYTERASTAVVASNEAVPAMENNESLSPAVSSENMEVVVSPIVGVVYLQPSPDKEPFKRVGDAVKKGEVICIIEAMKLMNEIVATADGVVSEILVANEEVVEYEDRKSVV